MSEGDPLPEGLAEVVRLSTSLAYRVLNTQLMGSPVPPDQVQALVSAAKLMHEHGMDWPPERAGKADLLDGLRAFIAYTCAAYK